MTSAFTNNIMCPNFCVFTTTYNLTMYQCDNSNFLLKHKIAEKCESCEVNNTIFDIFLQNFNLNKVAYVK